MKSIIKNKKGIAPIFVALSIIASVFTILSLTGIIQFDVASIIGSGGYIERPVFYYDKCEAVSSLKYSEVYTLATNGQWLNKPSVTNQYSITININDLTFNTCHQVEYYICNSKTLSSESNCRVYSKKITAVREGDSILISNVKPDEYVWAQFQKSFFCFDYDGSSGATYQVSFIPYGLRQYNVLGGSGAVINPNSCTYPSTQSDTIISSDADSINDAYRGVDTSTNQRVLQPEEVRWYVAGYLTSASPSFALTYSGQRAWCRPTGTGAEIYAINEIQTSGGTYKIASADWSDYLGSETCCPGQTRGDEVCNDNFQWEIVGGSECGIFNSCGSPNWVPYSENTLIKYSCVNGYCESETKTVECASDYDCIDSNEVCDLNSYTCEQANVNIKGQVIETIPDSEAECIERGGKWITKEETDKSLLNYIGIGEPELIVTEYCQLGSGINWAFWIILIIFIFFLVVFGKPILITLRGWLKATPFGRVIP